MVDEGQEVGRGGEVEFLSGLGIIGQVEGDVN